MDYAWCLGVDCPLKTRCRRWLWHMQTATDARHPMQSYIVEPYDPLSDTCPEQLAPSIHEED